jgi:hypothetical protein
LQIRRNLSGNAIQAPAGAGLAEHSIGHGLKKCGECRKQFTAKVCTVFEDAKLPVHAGLFRGRWESMTDDPEKSQSDKFKEAARALGCDENEARLTSA